MSIHIHLHVYTYGIVKASGDGFFAFSHTVDLLEMLQRSGGNLFAVPDPILIP